jgi:predicted dienelactone hydrolase
METPMTRIVRFIVFVHALVLASLAVAAEDRWMRPGAATVGIVQEEWHDASRSRVLPVKLYVPAGAGPFPIIVFSHGLGGSREGGRAWGEFWASHGYLCIHLQHPGSDETLWKGAAPSERMQALRQGANGRELVARTRDVRFAIDEIRRRHAAREGPLAAADPERIGMSGHSFGAVTTQAVSGQRYRAGAGAGELAEPRVRAAIAFSPSAPGGERAAAHAFGGIAIPFFGITGTADGDVLGNGATPENRALPVRYMTPPDKYLLVLDGADHMFFNGQPELPRRRAAGSSAQLELAQAATTAFWDAYLRNDPAAQRWLADGGFAQRLGGAGEFLARR